MGIKHLNHLQTVEFVKNQRRNYPKQTTMLDSIIVHDRNPLGGRPAGVGSYQTGIFYGGHEEVTLYHLGYCPGCGIYIRATREQAKKIAQGITRHINTEEQKESLWDRMLWKIMPEKFRVAIRNGTSH